MASSAHPSRFRTFSLRTFFVLVTILAVAIGLFVRRVHDEQAAATALEKLDFVFITYEPHFWTKPASRSPTFWFHARHSATTIYLQDYQTMLEVLPNLRKLPNLRELHLPYALPEPYQREAKFLEHELPGVKVLYDIALAS
jgi:hypothetical protein